MTTTRAVYNRNGEVDYFVASSDAAGGFACVDRSRPRFTATRMSPIWIVLGLVLALVCTAVAIVRQFTAVTDYSEQTVLRQRKSDSPGTRAPALAGVIVLDAEIQR